MSAVSGSGEGLMGSATSPTSSSSASGVSIEDLEHAARTRVFFGHQSVGANVLDGVPAVFAAHGIDPPVGYAADLGHLNADGARRAATAWLSAVARAAVG